MYFLKPLIVEVPSIHGVEKVKNHPKILMVLSVFYLLGKV